MPDVSDDEERRGQNGDKKEQDVHDEKEFYEDLDSAVRSIPTYEAFTGYYGEFDAADQWIQAAFAGSRVVLGGKEFDFANLNLEGRTGEL